MLFFSIRRKRRTILILALLIAWLVAAQFSCTFRISNARAQEQFQKEGVRLRFGHALVNNCRLQYAQTGNDDQPTLFFIHGSPGSWTAFADYLKDADLLRLYRLISVDRPGFGHSNYGQAYPISEQTDMLAAVLQQLQNGQPVYLVGHSLGGPIAVKLAARLPHQVQGLVLLAPSVDPAEEKPERWRPVVNLFPLRYFIPGALRPSNLELWYFKKEVQTMPADLGAVRCPVVIVHGLKDKLVPPGNVAYAERALKAAPSIRKIMLAGAGHFFPWEDFTAVKDVLLTLNLQSKR